MVDWNTWGVMVSLSVVQLRYSLYLIVKNWNKLNKEDVKAILGIRLLLLNSQDQPLQLNRAQNILHYTVTPMCIAVLLNTVYSNTIVDFHLSYE